MVKSNGSYVREEPKLSAKVKDKVNEGTPLFITEIKEGNPVRGNNAWGKLSAADERYMQTRVEPKLEQAALRLQVATMVAPDNARFMAKELQAKAANSLKNAFRRVQ